MSAEADAARARATVGVCTEIARKRRRVLHELRAALLRDDMPAVVQWARRITGLDDEESDRADAGLH
jgi:hypothetical protein